MIDLTGLETSRKLKEAGLPQEGGEFYWWTAFYNHPQKKQVEVVATICLHKSEDPMAQLSYQRKGRYAEINCVARAFSADELMQELTRMLRAKYKDVSICVGVEYDGVKWLANAHDETGSFVVFSDAMPSAAEAVAAVILQEKGGEG